MRLDPQRERIQDDLRGLVDGEVRCDDVFVQMFAGDASIYEIRPLGVVRPHSTADVVACVQYAAQEQIPLHARGAGTGLAGESLGEGLVIDFSRYLRRVVGTGDEQVRVQPGVVHERLNKHLRLSGRQFGPDPADSRMTTIGGLLGRDGSGSRRLKYGSARRHVLGLRVVLADGTVMEVGREPLCQGRSADADPRKRALIDAVVSLLASQAASIARHRPRCDTNRCGYQLWDVLTDDSLDLARLIVGSEGTLALITEALLATQPLPRYRGLALLLFESLEKAARAVREVLAFEPSACDLMDRRHLSLARETEVRFDVLIPSGAEAMLLVEQEGRDQVEVRSRLRETVDHVWRRQKLARDARQTFDPAEMEFFWSLSDKGQPWLRRMKGSARPVPVVDDVAVPPEILPEFLVTVQNVLKRQQVIASTFCHAGHGQFHILPFLDLADAEDLRKMRCLADDLYQEVLAAGGTISGEHACGLSRTPYVRQQFGELVEVFRKVKWIFDPQGILNPGKIVGDDPDLMLKNLRPAIAEARQWEPPAGEGKSDRADGDRPPPMRDLLELQLNWDPARVVDEVRACNGCGDCRCQAAAVRMCPIFRILPAEEASPRAKANLIRGVLTGKLPLSSLTSGEFKQTADLCVNCHMCAVECPARVDIPKLMLEGKGAYVAANGLDLHDRIVCRLDLLSAAACRVSPLANWALENRFMRWLMEKTLGIAQGRKLPGVTSRTFLRRAARRKLTRPARRGGRRAAYFVDLYANYHDPQLAEATVAVLEHNGVSVFVPPEQVQAGTAAISCGALDIARQLARQNVAVLAEAVRQGYHVVATEPAAALSLIREYPNLLNDDDVRLVADNTSEVCTYLWRMHTQGKLQLDLHPVYATLGYHAPCRLKALGVGLPGERLLRLIPGLSIELCEEGCSGMAGTYGLRRETFRASLRAGLGLIGRLRDPSIEAGTTECSACKMQMEQGIRKPTIHPIKLLALSYGIMPELETLLASGGGELVVS
jgi:FAD/FMN-containing dehydrogenase/Fe-S oxidoreductase